ncbi:MAG: hypothetical protein IPO60_09815 [Flavobacteriales bacterium]|nr:hypothetical protein [Flavobacteriales bacterium]
MAETVRFNIDHHQLRVVVSFMDLYLADPPSGEVHNLLHSIVGQQALGLKRKLLLQRLEYRLTMPVHFALAFRRMVLAALEGSMKARTSQPCARSSPQLTPLPTATPTSTHKPKAHDSRRP